LGLAGLVGYGVLVSLKGAMNLVAKDFFETFASYGFTVIPRQHIARLWRNGYGNEKGERNG
jgi:hypothetical protein